MNRYTKFLAVLAIGASACVAGAQPPRGHHPPPLVAALDANHDGVIDKTEVANSSVALLKLDTNGDGTLSADELRPRHGAQGQRPSGPPPDGVQGAPPPPPQGESGRPPGPPPGGFVDPIMKALDANQDGILDTAEIANAPKALLTLDKNGDGQITRDEIMPPPPSARQGSL